jgi:hypothetical protein
MQGNYKCRNIFIIVVFSFACLSSNAQNIILQGKVTDSVTNEPLVGANVLLLNNDEQKVEITNKEGVYKFSNIFTSTSPFTIQVVYLGYKRFFKKTTFKSNGTTTLNVLLQPDLTKINEVNIIGHTLPVAQRGDTTEMAAKAYKVNPDADGLSLVQKMPGVTVESGTVKAHGEEIKRVLLDGKNYFGDDASLALQNLPADVIDKVQIYDKSSEQSEFTGFNDGNTQKVMNIVTRADRRSGHNDKYTAGYGNDNHYSVNGRINYSDEHKRFTINGGSNNVNQQNFSFQDMLGATGGRGGPRTGGGPAFFGRMNGLNTIHSGGINYMNLSNSKLVVNASYFGNWQKNYTNSFNDQEMLGIIDTMKLARYQDVEDVSRYINYNHRIDARIEYAIDTLNSIVYSPRFSIQQNNMSSKTNTMKFNSIQDTISNSLKNDTNKGSGYSISNELNFRHKFLKKGRTISLSLQATNNIRRSDDAYIANSTSALYSDITNEKGTTKTNEDSYTSSLNYTEPVGSISQVMLSYRYSLNKNSNRRYVYNRLVIPYQMDDSVSNEYENEYQTQAFGLSYLIRSNENTRYNLGCDYQLADLSGDQVFPKKSKVDKKYKNFLPNAMLEYKFSKTSNLRIRYRTSTRPPSVNQLQNVIDVSNSIRFYAGNPDLKHQYSHNINSNYRFSDPVNFTNFNFNLFGTYTLDPIGNKTLTLSRDTVLQGKILRKYGQLVTPVNTKDSWNVRFFSNYGFLFKPIKCNITFMGGAGYSTSQGYVNELLSTTKTSSVMVGLVIASNISENIDFTGSYNGNYTHSLNALNPNLNSEVWNHSLSLQTNFILWYGFIIQNSLNDQINTGMGSAFNKQYLIWNFAFGKKFFKNKSGQLTFNVYDALNQNTSVNRTVTELYITDNRSNVLGRYYMLTFTYTFRSYKGAAPSNEGEGFRPRFDGIPHDRGSDRGPGGPPPGVPF